MELYISNIPFTATNEDLEKVCAQYGTVTRVNVVRDRNTGRPKGFAFAEYEDRAHGESAIAGINGMQFMGRELKAREAMPKRQ